MTDLPRLPYPGLRAFTREESDLFFGREGCVDDMVDRLSATRFLAVLGPSGSGKSSLVRTGLLDALDLGLNSLAGSSWRIADLHPGGQPMRKLAAALLQATTSMTPDQADIEALKAYLGRGPRSAIEWASQGNLPSSSNLLILVDQFEELFRYEGYAQREEAEAFVALLLESASAASVAIHVVVTMRSEYLGACASMPDLAERMSAGLYLTPRMNREECGEAIEGPADVLGFRVESALVNRLLNDLGSLAPWDAGGGIDLAQHLSHQADQLPLMQHVLNRLWAGAEYVAGGVPVLMLADYERIGGLAGALDAHGNEVMAALGVSRAQQIEDIFRALVSGPSASIAVRRPCLLRELIEIAGGARKDVVAIVEAFRAAGCNFIRTSEQSLASDDVIVDISHESLIRQWTPLREWLEKEARAAAAWRRIVAAEERYSQGEGGLLTGLDLHNLASWWESAAPTPIWASRYGSRFEVVPSFMETSRRAEALQAEAERRRQTRERNRLRIGVAGLAVALVVVASLGLGAFHAKREAEQQHISAEIARKARDEAMASKVENARNTAAFMDDVSNLAYSDRFKSLVGVSGLQAELMQAILSHQSYQSGPASRVRDEYRMGISLDAIGKAAEARDSYAKAHEDGLKIIESLPDGQEPSEALAANLIDASYRYAWFLFDIGEIKKGEEVMRRTEAVVAHLHIQSPSMRLLVAYGRFESLESRYYHDRKQKNLESRHSLAALAFAMRAMAMPGADLDAAWFEFNSYRNRALDFQGPEQEKLKATACVLVDAMIAKSPADERSIKARVECLRDQAGRDRDKKHLDQAAEDLGKAREIIAAYLQTEPGNQALLLSMAEIENDLATLSFTQGNQAVQKSHTLAAERSFAKALRSRTLFQANSTLVKRLYQDFKLVDFSKPDQDGAYSTEEIDFYRDVLKDIDSSVQAFPHASSFVYVAADASAHMGGLLNKDPKQALVAETYLSNAIDWFDKIGTIHDLSNFSEDFSVYCGIYSERAKLYASTGRIDLVLRDVKKMRDVCSPALNKYPWDIYLRSQFQATARIAGQALFDGHRYRDALPYLEYASHWGAKDSSRLLAQMYREGLGLEKNELKAKQLETLAEGQILTRYTIPIDFSGVKFPFNIYVRDWPAEYPFEGIDDQAIWLKEARGATVPPEVIESFHKLLKIAHENKVSFRQLTEYALSSTKKDAADNSQEVEAARKKYRAEASAESLESLKNAANKLYEQLIKDNKQSEAGALQSELVADAENLVKKNPGIPTYRIAWDILTDQGDRLRSSDRDAAQKAFARSAELVDLLPQDNAADLHKRLFTCERLGDMDFQAGRIENARQWYAKEVEAARKRYALEVTAKNLESLRISANRLHQTLVKLKQEQEAGALLESMTSSADTLLAHSQSDVSLEELVLVYTGLAETTSQAGDAPQARRNLMRAQELGEKISKDTPNGAYGRYHSFGLLSNSFLKSGSAIEARAAYLQASLSLERYVALRTASPPQRAEEDTRDLSDIYGSLSFMQVLAGNFPKAVEAAQRGLEIKPDAAWIEANLAHALLLSGKQQEAIEYYMKARKGTLNQRSILDATRDDFETLKSLGFGHPAMEAILKQMAKE